MKTIAIETETRHVAEWLPKEDSEEIIYLTRQGRTRFVLVPLDEGDEEELLALQLQDTRAKLGFSTLGRRPPILAP